MRLAKILPGIFRKTFERLAKCYNIDIEGLHIGRVYCINISRDLLNFKKNAMV